MFSFPFFYLTVINSYWLISFVSTPAVATYSAGGGVNNSESLRILQELSSAGILIDPPSLALSPEEVLQWVLANAVTQENLHTGDCEHIGHQVDEREHYIERPCAMRGK